MPPSSSMRSSRPSLLERRASSGRGLASNPSFSRLTSSGQAEQLARYKQRSESLTIKTPKIIADRYRVIAPFHEGKSMSAVYLTKDTKTGELVVVKVASDVSNLEMSTAAIRREIRALSRLSHPNIVRIKGDGCWDGKEFVVLEYLRGADLYLVLGDYSRLPWRIAKHVILQLCDALHAAHSENIMHDDIKPENIIISRMDDIGAILLDFGLAKFMDAEPDDELLVIPGLVVGTFPYMAPETFDFTHYDYRADVYSLGVVIYEMLAGTNPFDGHNIPRVVDRILEHTPELPSECANLPECVDDIVMRAIAKDPEERFQSIAELSRAIRSCP